MRVFLGGTCSGYKWRNDLMPMLDGAGIDYFNPIVTHWDDKAQAREIAERQSCDYVLYVVTPDMKAPYSIAEVVDDSNKRPDKTIFCVMGQWGHRTHSMMACKRLVESNGAKVCNNLEGVYNYLAVEKCLIDNR